MSAIPKKIVDFQPRPKNTAVKCVRDTRNLPLEAYRLPTDGRKWRRLCEQRQRVAMHLATYADGDGSSIRVSIAELVRLLGVSRRSLFYWLDDLKTLGMLTDNGLTRYHGTRWRTLSPAIGVQDSREAVQDSPKEGVQDSKVRVQDSIEGVQDSQSRSAPLHCTLPSFIPPKQTVPPTEPEMRWEGILSKTSATIGANPTEKETRELEKLFSQHGEELMGELLWQFERRRKGFAGVTQPWLLFLREFPALLRTEQNRIAAEKVSAERRKAAADDSCIQAQKERAKTLRILAEREARENAGPTVEEIMAD